MLVLESSENAHSEEYGCMRGGVDGRAGCRLHKAGLEDRRGHMWETPVSGMDGGNRLSATFLTSSVTPFQAILNPAAAVTLQKPQVSSFPSSVRDVSCLGGFIQKFSIRSLRNPPRLSWLVWLHSATPGLHPGGPWRGFWEGGSREHDSSSG